MLLHLAWRRNLDGLDLALAANRLAAGGVPLWWLGAAGPVNEPGDYLCDADAATAEKIAAFGIVADRWSGELSDAAVAIAYPRIALLSDGSPYYAAALARLGFACELVDATAIAGGALAGFDLLVLPGGTSAWGLDAADGVSGADAAVREFLAAHGAALASGGGARYLSSGRPGCAGVAPVGPVYTHEYLRTGVGLVSLLLGADSIGFGCPPTIDMPYCHGPVFARLDRAVSAAATFDRLVMGSGLFSAEPLDDDIFARVLAGNAAIVRSETARGRAVLFSGNPEMGDLVRKQIALESYVPRHLPIAGEAATIDMLRHYRPLESPSWRLILNAIHSLMLRHAPPGAVTPLSVSAQSSEPGRRLVETAEHALAASKLVAAAPLAAIAEVMGDDLRARLTALQPRLARTPALEASAVGFLDRASGAAPAPAERLAAIEAAITLAEAGCRLAEADRHFHAAA